MDPSLGVAATPWRRRRAETALNRKIVQRVVFHLETRLGEMGLRPSGKQYNPIKTAFYDKRPIGRKGLSAFRNVYFRVAHDVRLKIPP